MVLDCSLGIYLGMRSMKCKMFGTVIFTFIFIVSCNVDKIANEKLVRDLQQAQINVASTENFYMVREATPSLLIMLDSTIKQNPNELELLLQAAKTHLSYGRFFVPKDSPQWASMHYIQARKYANQFCISKYNINLLKAKNQKELSATLSQLPQKSINAIFLLAASWLSWIDINSENIEALDGIPYVEVLLNQVINWDSSHENGLPYILLGNIQQDVKQFEEALRISDRKYFAIHVAYAKYLGKRSIKKDVFENLLEEVSDKWDDREELPTNWNLVNSISYEEAKSLLYNIDDYYEEDDDDDDDDDDEDDEDDDDEY